MPRDDALQAEPCTFNCPCHCFRLQHIRVRVSESTLHRALPQTLAVLSSAFSTNFKGAFTGRAARIRRGAARSSGLKPDGSPARVLRKTRLISQCCVLVKCCELTTFVVV